MPDLKAKLLMREAHSPLDLERMLNSAIHETSCHGAMRPISDGLDASHTGDGTLPVPDGKRLSVRLREPPGIWRLDGAG